MWVAYTPFYFDVTGKLKEKDNLIRSKSR